MAYAWIEFRDYLLISDDTPTKAYRKQLMIYVGWKYLNQRLYLFVH